MVSLSQVIFAKSCGARDIWWPLLLAAALLFPLDVAVRRLVITRADVRRARAWLNDRLPWRKTAPGASGPVVLGDLFRARERARRQTERGQSAPRVPPAQAGEQPVSAPEPQKPEESDTFARLRDAKKKRKP